MAISTILTTMLIITTFIVFATSEDINPTKFDNVYDIANFGATGKPNVDSSLALEDAWNLACYSYGSSMIFVPPGRFLVSKAIKFYGMGCESKNITFVIKGTIVAPTNPHVLGNANNWFEFVNVDGITISGGVFDGEGTQMWACKKYKNGVNCPSSATNLRFTNSKNVVIDGVTSINSQLYHIVFNGCKNVVVKQVTISAPFDSPNTDGIHVQKSSNVSIMSSYIATGDDCISIGDGTTNLWIEEIVCGPGHGISIGSLGKSLHEVGVKNVTVQASTFTNTRNGVRIKSWARSSSGFVKHVRFQHLKMVNVQNPIIIDQKYCPHQKDCPKEVSGVRVSDVTYKDIHGTSATKIAAKFDCSSKNHCSRLKLEDVYLTYKDESAYSSCSNSKGLTHLVVQPQSCLIPSFYQLN